MVCSCAPELTLGVQPARSWAADWALVLIAELQADVSVLSCRLLRDRGRELRLRLLHRQDEAVGQILARNESRAHRHAAASRAENMLLTVVSSFAEEA